ncbi:hypothetical protein [Sphingomonas sp. BAUL-RG-20F-R05-02]|uniref:hypothetical protein n=1 Tax=Sphingomonas sp. BAUL-RG-20F-R05-02 TaxID=2914830 RepID=UPI001F59AB67|nr:hypothetical protein [Sphingomonas sp. BAUL-RG-20F-R05-02]
MVKSTSVRRTVPDLLDGLAILATDLDIRTTEVEQLIGIHGGLWPIAAARLELWWPSDEQFERITSLSEVCASAASLMGIEARLWMRRYNPGLGCSPVCFMLRGMDALITLRNILRQEQGRC